MTSPLFGLQFLVTCGGKLKKVVCSLWDTATTKALIIAIRDVVILLRNSTHLCQLLPQVLLMKGTYL